MNRNLLINHKGRGSAHFDLLNPCIHLFTHLKAQVFISISPEMQILKQTPLYAYVLQEDPRLGVGDRVTLLRSFPMCFIGTFYDALWIPSCKASKMNLIYILEALFNIKQTWTPRSHTKYITSCTARFIIYYILILANLDYLINIEDTRCLYLTLLSSRCWYIKKK